jgi:hypothetical protein
MLVYACYGYGVDRALNGGKDVLGHSVLAAALILLQVWAGFRVVRERPSGYTSIGSAV